MHKHTYKPRFLKHCKVFLTTAKRIFVYCKTTAERVEIAVVAMTHKNALPYGLTYICSIFSGVMQ